MSESRGRLSILALKLLDGLQYAVVLNGVVVAVLAPLTVLATGSLVALKWFLFLFGLPLIGYGPLKLRPALREKDSRSRFHVGDSYASAGFGGHVGRLPPVSLFDPEPTEHLSDGGRILFAGVGAWAVSFLMEAVLGVGVPSVG